MPEKEKATTGWASLLEFFRSLGGRSSVPAADVSFSGYYAPTHTWTATSDEPALSVEDAYRAAKDIKNVYPSKSETTSS